MTIKEMYDKILKLESKLNNPKQKYRVTDPDERAKIKEELDYLKDAHKQAMFDLKNNEIQENTFANKLKLDEELGYGKADDLRKVKKTRLTPIKRTEAQKKANEYFSKILKYRRQVREAAKNIPKEAPVNDMYKVARKFRLPFFLGKNKRKILTAGLDVPLAAKIAAGLGGGALSLSAEAAQEAFDAEDLEARKDMPDYYLERGVRDPEEQRQKALLHSFKENLESKEDSEIPSRYENPEIRKYKEDVLKAKKEGTLRDNYVEDIPEQEELNDWENIGRSPESMNMAESQPRFKRLSSLLKRG